MRPSFRLSLSFDATINHYVMRTELGESWRDKSCALYRSDFPKALPAALVPSLALCPFHLDEIFPNWLLCPTHQMIAWGFVC